MHNSLLKKDRKRLKQDWRQKKEQRLKRTVTDRQTEKSAFVIQWEIVHI